MSRMADRNVSKSPPGSLSPDVFRSHPPSFEAAGQQHSGSLAHASAHAHAHTYARVPARTRTHSARHAAGMTPSGVARQPPDRPPRPPSAPSIGPPGEIGHRFAQEAVGPNATPRPKMERWRNFRGRVNTLVAPRGAIGPWRACFRSGPRGMVIRWPHFFPSPGCRGAAPTPPHTPLYARAVNRAEDCLCFKQNLLKSVKRS